MKMNQKHAKDAKNMWKRVYCEKYHSWYHYECKDTTKKQIMKMHPSKTHSCKEDQKIEYEKTWIIKYNQLKKEIEKMKEEKAKVTKTVEEMTKNQKYQRRNKQNKTLNIGTSRTN